MCKILVMSGIKEPARKKAYKFIREMAVRMSQANNDGIGYAAIDEDDNLFAERWLKNSQGFRYLEDGNFGDAVEVPDVEYSSEGTINMNKLSSITLHTRLATCAKGLRNTHPFVKDGTSLIHNGMIRNPETYAPTISSCDSESLLNGYLQYDMGSNPDSIEEMVKPLDGYWAAAVYTKVDGKYVLDLFKFDANLHSVYIYDLKCWVFSTSSFDIEGACDKLGFDYSISRPVADKSYMRFNPHTGEVIFTGLYVKEKTYTSYQYSSKSKSSTNVSCVPYSEQNKAKEDKVKITVLTSEEFSKQVMGII